MILQSDNNHEAHGHGPVLLAGAEMIRMSKGNSFEINDSSVQRLQTKGGRKD